MVIINLVTVHKQFAQLDINPDPEQPIKILASQQVVQLGNIGMVQQHHAQLASPAVTAQGSAVSRMEHARQQLERILAQHQKLVGQLEHKLVIQQ
jgi:hypothetical protein